MSKFGRNGEAGKNGRAGRIEKAGRNGRAGGLGYIVLLFAYRSLIVRSSYIVPISFV